MTLRLCLIGNSHLAAMKLGWDQLVAEADPAIAGVGVTFFGAPRDMLKAVEVRDGILVPGNAAVRSHFVTLSGQEQLDPAAYDAFLLVGLGASFKRVLRLYQACRWPGVAACEEVPLISPTMARAILTDGYGSTRLLDIGTKLAQLTDKPIFALHEPLWAPRSSPCPGNRDFGWIAAAELGDGAALAALFAQALGAATRPRLQLLMQPPATVDEQIMTAPAFNRNADKDISGAGGGIDAAHMNADFGACVLRHHLGVIRAAADPSSAAASQT